MGGHEIEGGGLEHNWGSVPFGLGLKPLLLDLHLTLTITFITSLGLCFHYVSIAIVNLSCTFSRGHLVTFLSSDLDGVNFDLI